MLSELIQLSLDKIMQSRSYTAVILGTTEKQFAIYVEATVGKTMQLALTEAKAVRPLTHDLLNMVLMGLGVRVKQIVLVDVQDAVYYARIFLEQHVGEARHIVEIDARPSDCLVLAIMNDVPLFCTRQVLEKSTSIA